jgi:competence protein ComEA
MASRGTSPKTYIGGVPGPGTSGSATAGQLVNINTASVVEMRQSLHISTTTAQSIVNYRQQNGPFTSIDQLQQVVSKTIFAKIKGLVTI